MSKEKTTNSFIVLSGPSGSGKSTLLKQALDFYGPDKLRTTVSHTTRPPRGREKDSKDYYYVSEERFLELIKQKFFMEWAVVYGHHYGTAMDQVLSHWQQGCAIIKDCDLQGAGSIKKCFPQAVRVFITVPSLQVLKERVSKREENTDTEMSVRIKAAEEEIKQASRFEHQIINEDISKSLEKLKKIIDSCI